MADSAPRKAGRSAREVLAGLAAPAGSPQAGTDPAEAVLLQDWTPLSGSLEWRLSRFYWASAGLDGFVGSEVPYVVNNTSWVARSAATVFLAQQEAVNRSHEPILLLELGAGLGLFARHFLDALRAECLDRGRTEYDRVVYCVTDGSERTVERWSESELFAGHAKHVVAGICDAEAPDRLRVLGNATPLPAHMLSQRGDGAATLPAGSLSAIFANYLFDSLPTTILRGGAGATLEELQIRTRLPATTAAAFQERSGLHPAELATQAAKDEETALRALLPLLSSFEFELEYRPLQEAPRHVGRALDFFAKPAPHVTSASSVSHRIILNYGALDSLEACASLLTPDGVLLFRDLGPVVPERIAELSYAGRFGPTIATAVNFPIVESFLSERGFSIASPPGDDARAIHTRLAGRNLPESTRERFGSVFAEDLHAKADALANEALAHIQAGRSGSALACYQRAVDLCPDDWHLLGNVAQFLTQQLFQFPEAIEIAERALALNPEFSSFLWNTLGNARFCLGDHAAAHEAYLRARTIRPRDPQAHLNLAYTFAARGDFDSALLAIGTGLACDPDGRFELVLLGKQKEVVEQIQNQRRAEREREERRHELFTNAR